MMGSQENENDEMMDGKHRRLYEESLVQNIMLATAYCIKDLLEENADLDDEDIYEFVEDNYKDIIRDTLDEFQNREQGEEGEGEVGEDEPGPDNGETPAPEGGEPKPD